MTTQTEALTLALEALEGFYEYGYDRRECFEHITAIKEALAQPEQTNTRPYYTIDELNAWADEKEKQAWRNAAIRVGEELSSVGPDGYYDMNAWQWLDWAMQNVKKAQPEQEPVAWATKDDFYRELERELKRIREEMKIKSVTMRCKDYDIALPIIGADFGRVLVGQVSTTPQRTWVGLTDEEIDQGLCRTNYAMQTAGAWRDGVDWAIKQLKERNA